MNFVPTVELRRKLEKFSNLPSVPQIIVKIRQVSEDPKATAADLANCILSDHQLTGRILRTANSAYYGEFAGKINTVTHAIVVMGFRAVQNITISMAMYDVVNNVSKSAKFDMVAFWTRSLASGVIAKFLADRIRKTKLVEVAFIAGFMHDMGQAILAGAFPDKYAQICSLGDNREDVYEAERAILGIDHMAVGQYVAEKWKLPSGLMKPIADHHRIDVPPQVKSEELLIDLVYLSDLLYPHVMGGTSPTSEVYAGVIEQAQALIDISEADMIELLLYCRKQVEEIASELKINIDHELEKCAIVGEGSIELHHQLANKEVQLAFLQNSTDSLMEAKSSDETLQVVCEAILRGMQMGRVIVFAYDPKSRTFSGKVGFGLESQQAVQALRFSARKGIFRYLHETGQPISTVSGVGDICMDTEEAMQLEARSYCAVPITVLDVVEYVLFADAPVRDDPIPDDTFRSIISLTRQSGMVLERMLLKAQLHRS